MQEVVLATGVTSRTLRHYDAIGLLPVQQKGAGGERLYGPAELVRLQRILVLRELGLPLSMIADVLAGSIDDAAALRAHGDQLRRQRDRIERMISAVERTVDGLAKGVPMEEAGMFEGFADDPYAQEAHERWPDNYAQSQRQLTAMSPQEQRALFERGEELTRLLGAALESGAAPGDAPVQALIAAHYAWVTAFWTPNRSAYVGLGRMYVDDPRFAANYDAVAPGLAVFMRDAIEAWAEVNLSD